VAYFAAALVRQDGGWSGSEVDLSEVEDLDGVVEQLRSVADEAETWLLLVEENDEWFGIVRLDGDDDPRVFLSDARATDTSPVASILAEAAEVVDVDDPDADDELDDEDDDADEPTQAAGDPLGDSDVMADLGTPAKRLLALCAEEGQLPADILSAVCEAAGCLEVLDSLRVA
jgi:putative tRNA adenosine deaminase-associated protein